MSNFKEEIVSKIDPTDEESLTEAASRLKSFSDQQLRVIQAVSEAEQNGASQWTAWKVLLEREIDRRKSNEIRKLTKEITYGASMIGAIGALVGALVGAFLSYLLS